MESVRSLPRYVINAHGTLLTRRRFAMKAPDIAFLFVTPPGLLACSRACDLGLSDTATIDKMVLAAMNGKSMAPIGKNGLFEEPMLAAPTLYFGRACPDHLLEFKSDEFAVGIYKAPLPAHLAANYGHTIRSRGEEFRFKNFVERNRESLKFPPKTLVRLMGSETFTLSKLYALLDGKVTGNRHPGLYICAFCRQTEDTRGALSLARVEQGPNVPAWVRNSIVGRVPPANRETQKRKVNERAEETNKFFRQKFTTNVYPFLSAPNRKRLKAFVAPTRGKVAVNITEPGFDFMRRVSTFLNERTREKVENFRGRWEARLRSLDNPRHRAASQKYLNDYLVNQKAPPRIVKVYPIEKADDA